MLAPSPPEAGERGLALSAAESTPLTPALSPKGRGRKPVGLEDLAYPTTRRNHATVHNDRVAPKQRRA